MAPSSPQPPTSAGPYLLRGAAHRHLHVVALPGLAAQVVDHLHEAAGPLGVLRCPAGPGTRRRASASP